jgi:hypothetical protein
MKLQTPLEKHPDARAMVIALMSQGLSFEEVALKLSEEWDEAITAAMVEFEWHKIKEQPLPSLDNPSKSVKPVQPEPDRIGLNTVDELVWLYKQQLARVKRLRELEDTAQMPIPETRENIALAASIIDKLGDLLGGGKSKSIEQRKQELLFGKGESEES